MKEILLYKEKLNDVYVEYTSNHSFYGNIGSKCDITSSKEKYIIKRTINTFMVFDEMEKKGISKSDMEKMTPENLAPFLIEKNRKNYKVTIISK